MDFLNLFKHLLPDGKAWRITISKQLRYFFEGLTVIPENVKENADGVWSDLLPSTTDKLDEWELQFGIPPSVTVVADRRARLSATWRSLAGGQSPRYIQDTLQASGFDVYVHEWWEPLTSPPVARDPLMWLRREFTNANFVVGCGEPLAQCGEPFAEAGNSLEPRGYPLVNIIFETVPELTPLCGELLAQCGEPTMTAGYFDMYQDVPKNYIVPREPEFRPYFLYIGGETFGTLAQVDPKRRSELEALCLKIAPSQQWLGMLVEYV